MNDQITPIITDVLETMARSPETKQFAVFDFDNTCIEHDIAEALLSYLCANQLLKNNALLDIQFENKEVYHQKVLAHYYELLEKGEIERAYRFTTQMLAGFHERDIKHLVSKTIVAEGTEIGTATLYDVTVAKGLRVRTDVIALLTALQTRHIKIWIVSASPEVVVKAALSHYNIPGNCIGMRLQNLGHVFSDVVVEPLSTLEGKVTCIQRYIHPAQQPILGIGDSMNDFPMLDYSHIKVVVNRHNKLAEEAAQNNWHLITA
ncbi:MAG: haloacid dehalogenase [Candidatus Nomurabacteria bacterium]|nr:haloacid dehalogenase [Candidatus Nomurabacteria bacterium]